MFNDHAFRDEVGLGAVNSITWARIMGQIVYYFWAALQLGAPDRPVNFAVPTGNFGNVFAGYAAKNMGLPIEWLGVSSNRNDILTRFFERNDMSLAPVEPSHSPSMDIQVSSNFERLLFDLMGRDGKAVAQAIQDFRANGRLDVGRGGAGSRPFDGYRLGDPETLAAMADWRVRTNGQVLDPHRWGRSCGQAGTDWYAGCIIGSDQSANSRLWIRRWRLILRCRRIWPICMNGKNGCIYCHLIWRPAIVRGNRRT